MSLFIDTLTDADGNEYDYGHCYRDNDTDYLVTGCGMEYVYYPETQLLESWHDGVGLVTTSENVTSQFIAELSTLHEYCH